MWWVRVVRTVAGRWSCWGHGDMAPMTWLIMAAGRIILRWEESTSDYLQGEQEKRQRQLYASLWEGDRAANHGNHLWAQEGEVISCSHDFTKKSSLTNLTRFHDEMGVLIDEMRGQQWMVFSWTSARPLTVSPLRSSDKLLSDGLIGLDEQAVKWIENCLSGPEGSEQWCSLFRGQ